MLNPVQIASNIFASSPVGRTVQDIKQNGLKMPTMADVKNPKTQKEIMDLALALTSAYKLKPNTTLFNGRERLFKGWVGQPSTTQPIQFQKPVEFRQHQWLVPKPQGVDVIGGGYVNKMNLSANDKGLWTELLNLFLEPLGKRVK